METLSLSWSALGDEDVQALAPHLSDTLQMLNLDNNSIGDEGVQELIAKFPVTLRHLGLDDSPIKDAGFSDLLAWAPTTDLESLTIPRPSNLTLRKQFENLRNQEGKYITILFGSFENVKSTF